MFFIPFMCYFLTVSFLTLNYITKPFLRKLEYAEKRFRFCGGTIIASSSAPERAFLAKLCSIMKDYLSDTL